MTAESSKIYWSFSLALLCFALHYSALSDAAELQEITDIKFAFYSSQWGAPTDDGMRLIVFNQTEGELRLESIEFLKDEQQAEPIPIAINLSIPPMGYAEEEFEYIDLLRGDECIDRTLDARINTIEKKGHLALFFNRINYQDYKKIPPF